MKNDPIRQLAAALKIPQEWLIKAIQQVSEMERPSKNDKDTREDND